MQRPIRILPGASDLSGQRLEEVAALRDLLLSEITSWGYARIETPLLEEADLFLRKSGGELAAQLYGVDDPGGRRVALRPEYTASGIRAFIAVGDDDGRIPSRWCYAGPVLRHQPLEQGEGRQVTQIGAELVGASGPLADAEILAIACEGLKRAGIRRSVITLGHLDVLGGLLQGFGLSGRAELFLLSRLNMLKDPDQGMDALLEEARLLRLLPNGADVADNGGLDNTLTDLAPQEARSVVHKIVAALGPGWVGSREMDEVESRLLDKLRESEDPEKMQQAVRFLAELARIRGDGPSVLREAEAVVRRYGLEEGRLEPLAQLVEMINALPDMNDLQKVWDLGFAPGLAYYTGFVFELTHPDLPGRALGSGGRYDGLVKALGGADLPALGFAYSLELMDEARRIESAPPLASSVSPVEALVVPQRPEDAAAALVETRRLQAQAPGAVIALFPEAGALEAARAYARRIAARALVVVGPDGARSELLGRD